jgi:CheY-like chemotaxis protein
MSSVLVVEDALELAELVHALLVDEGYQVVTVPDPRGASVRLAVERCAPDCVLLDSSGAADYGESWDTAIWLRQRRPVVPTIMFTAHLAAVQEARAGVTQRSQAAGLVAAVAKPFELEELVAAVARAVSWDGH